MLKSATHVLFREVQHFRQLWLWIIVLAIAGVAIYSVIQQLILDQPFGNNPASDTVVLALCVIFGVAFPVLFYRMNLTVEVREDGLHYRLFPFHLSFQRIGVAEIRRCEPVSYRPLRDYGGWGIRYGMGGKAYNISGNRGVQLELINGRRILIGSQKPEELAAAIRSLTGAI